MQGCANDTGKLIGKVAVLRMAFGCADTLPALSDWKLLGALTTKGFDFSPNSVTSEADDAKGLVENLVTSMDFTISGKVSSVVKTKPLRSARSTSPSTFSMKSRLAGSRRSGCASISSAKTPHLHHGLFQHYVMVW